MDNLTYRDFSMYLLFYTFGVYCLPIALIEDKSFAIIGCSFLIMFFLVLLLRDKKEQRC